MSAIKLGSLGSSLSGSAPVTSSTSSAAAQQQTQQQQQAAQTAAAAAESAKKMARKDKEFLCELDSQVKGRYIHEVCIHRVAPFLLFFLFFFIFIFSPNCRATTTCLSLATLAGR